MKNDLFINNLLAALSTSLASDIGQGVGEVGLRSNNAAAALVTIVNHPDDSIDVLRRTLELTHSGAVRLIDALVGDALVERRPNELDGRSVVLRATALGERKARAILQARASATNKAMAHLTDEQKTALAPILRAMLGALTDDYEGARRNCRLCHEGVCRPQGCPVEHASNDAKPERA